jgi:pimeloyl-ACP methyl ester carboxylesterase
MKSVLLTNAMGPYESGWGQDVNDLFAARLSREQGPFTLKGYFHAFALHLLAENLDAETTVIEWPTERLLRAELKKGYDYLGIQVKTVHMASVAGMVKIAKEVAPETKIVLGGYGVMHIHNPFPYDPEGHAGYLFENADHFCYEEGVAFFRKLIGQSPDDPITQRYQPLAEVTLPGAEALARFPLSSTLVSLGCPNACEFCNTSHFFKFKKITLCTPEQACVSLKAANERMAGTPALFNMVWDEDFLMDRDYVLHLGELLQREGLIGKVNLFCFASIRSISQYTVQELARCGVGVLWIGIESKFEEGIVSHHNFHKRIGRDVTETIEELHNHGILVVCSNILGLDFHNRENILEDIDYFVSLKPDLYQVSPLRPCPGTQLYERMMKEGRIAKDYSHADCMLWSDTGFHHENFEHGEIRHFFHLTHKKLYETNGPTLLNVMDAMIKGYRNMIHSRDPYLQARADRCYFFAKKLAGGLLPAIKELAPSSTVRKRAEQVEGEYFHCIGNYSPGEKLVQRVALEIANAQSLKTRPEKSDPPYVVTRMMTDGSGAEVVKRKRPLHHAASRISTGVMRNLLGLRYRPAFPIKLAELDDFAVDFKTLEIEGNRINYVDEGQGETLLMLHGNPTWSYLYRHLIKDLRRGYRCVAPDHLGYGLSDKPPRADYSMEAHIRRLGSFVEELGLSDITLICQDWGGIIGLSYAVNNKERFSRLIPMNTTAFLPGTREEWKECMRAWAFLFLWSYKIPILGRKMAMDWNVFLKASLRLGTHNTRRQLHRRAMLGYLYPFQREIDRVAILKSVRQVPMSPRDMVWELLRHTEKALKGWNVRTRLIWGMQDPVFVPWFLEKFEEILPNHALSLRIPTAGHFLQDDEPDLIVRGIREFLNESLIPAREDEETVETRPPPGAAVRFETDLQEPSQAV